MGIGEWFDKLTMGQLQFPVHSNSPIVYTSLQQTCSCLSVSPHSQSSNSAFKSTLRFQLSRVPYNFLTAQISRMLTAHTQGSDGVVTNSK